MTLTFANPTERLLILQESEMLWEKYHMELLDAIIFEYPPPCHFLCISCREPNTVIQDVCLNKIDDLGDVYIPMFTMEHVAHAYINACRNHPAKSNRIQNELIRILNTYLIRDTGPIIKDIDAARRIVYDLNSMYAVKLCTISAAEAFMR